jgi:metal-sulfur cluster biosynthetic enzyme
LSCEMLDQIAANHQSRQLAELILAAANQILEPCGLAQGLSVGMVDMGLIRGVDVEQKGSNWSVRVRARVTSPDCLHFVYFERELRAAIAAIADFEKIDVEWIDGSDWTPDDMSPQLREQMNDRRRKQLKAMASPVCK